MKSLFSRRSPLSAQLFIFLVLASVLLMLDTNYRPFKVVRYYLDTLVAPLYHLANIPQETNDNRLAAVSELQTLREKNHQLTADLLIAQNNLSLLEQYKSENDRLRGLLNSPVRPSEHKMAADVLLAEMNSYIAYIAINKGKEDGVYEGQPVADAKGIVGQIYQVAKETSRAILICDRQHAIPVQILRNDIRMVAAGNGCENDLTISYLSNSADIKVGDKLVTSGLGGRFPEGYPVAIISSITIDPNDSMPIISATPIADLKRLRYLLLLTAQEGKQKND